MRAEVCADTAGDTTGNTVGCYVNTVPMALAVATPCSRRLAARRHGLRAGPTG